MPWRSDIPHKQQARSGYPSLQEMMAFSLKDKDYSPASTNLFTIHITTPALLKVEFSFLISSAFSSLFTDHLHFIMGLTPGLKFV